jgi:hypothetical protein
LLSQEELDVFFNKVILHLTENTFEVKEKGQQERELTTNQVGPCLKNFAESLMIKQLIVRYDGHLAARPLIQHGMKFLPDAQITIHSQRILAVEVKIIREVDPSGSLSKAIGQTLMYKALGFENSLGLIFDMRTEKHHSLAETLLSLNLSKRTQFLLFS